VASYLTNLSLLFYAGDDWTDQMFLTASFEAKLLKDMKKIFIYMMMAMSMVLVMSACSKFDANSEGIITKPEPTPDPTPTQDTLKWDRVVDKTLPINGNMIATPWIIYEKGGKRDSLQMESWLLDINTIDLVVYRDSYQPTTQSGKTPNADRSNDPEFKDKFGNMVTRHHYTQSYEFNNFMHSISGAWNTGYVIVNGKQEPFLPEDGLYYNVSYEVGDTVHIIKNDSIFAREDVKIKYTATLKVTAEKHSWQSWVKEATVTVISFVGLVEKEPEIPSADEYIANLEWHAAQANRFYNGSQWCDGILFSSKDKYYMLVTFFKLNSDKTKETLREIKMYSIAKSAMATPTTGREYNAVMWDELRNQPVPCLLSIDGNGWSLGSTYADGTRITKRHERSEGVMSGVKNLSEKDNATPSPWIASTWVETKYNGKNYYTVTWKTTTHTLSRTIADEMLKK
jgi:hypothetical protein